MRQSTADYLANNQGAPLYMKTPLGEALDEALGSMNVSNEFQQKLIDAFEKAMDEEFESMPSSNNQRQRLTADLFSYKNLFFDWEFRMANVNLNMEEANLREPDCTLFAMPHKDLKLNYVSKKKHGNRR